MNWLLRHNGSRRALWTTVVWVMVGGVVAVFRPQREAAPVSPQLLEVLRSELTLRNGRLHHSGGTNGFSGVMIERYPDGALRSRSAVLDGLLHGLSEGWHTNGQLQITEHFKAGVSDGLRTKWFVTGKKLSEAIIVEGKFDGPFLKWHENGVLAEQVQFSKGEPSGESLSYFPSGFMKGRVRLQAGKVVEQTFWRDGESNHKLLAQDRTP